MVSFSFYFPFSFIQSGSCSSEPFVSFCPFIVCFLLFSPQPFTSYHFTLFVLIPEHEDGWTPGPVWTFSEKWGTLAAAGLELAHNQCQWEMWCDVARIMATEAEKNIATAQTFSLGSGIWRRYFKGPNVIVMWKESNEVIKLKYGTVRRAGIAQSV